MHKVRELLVKQRTMLINALRGLMAEFGIVGAEGPRHVDELLGPGRPRGCAHPRAAARRARAMAREPASACEARDRRSRQADRRAGAATTPTCRHLNTSPATGRSCRARWRRSRSIPAPSAAAADFAASLGLAPRQDGTGGKVKLGPITKRGNGYLRRLLVNGATAVLQQQARQSRIPGWPSCSARSRARWSLCAGQQDGAHRLGGDAAPGGLPRRAGGGLSGRRRGEAGGLRG